jgi:hypothetical protein
MILKCFKKKIKNMKKILVLIFALFGIVHLFAQKSPVEVTMSDEYENANNNSVIEGIVKDKEGNTILIKRVVKTMGSDKIFVESFSPAFELNYSTELSADGTKGKAIDFYGAFNLKNEPYVLTSFYNRDRDFRYLLVSKIGKDGELSKPKRISEFKADSNNDGDFGIVFSKDSSKVLVINKLPTAKKEKESFSFVVLNSDFEEIWKGKASLPYENRDVALSDFTVDNQDNIFVLATLELGREEEVLQEIFEYKKGEKASKRYKINLKNKIINRLQLLPSADGTVIGVGQYSSIDEKSRAWRRYDFTTQGTVFFKINGEKGEVVEQIINPFDDKIFDFFGVSAQRIQKGFGVGNVFLKNAWIAPDNKIYLDFEEEYAVINNTNNMNNGFGMNPYGVGFGGFGFGGIGFRNNRFNNQPNSTTYFSGTHILVCLNEKGESLFETFVPKLIASVNNNTGLGHIVAHRSGKTYYIYNDNEVNVRKIATHRELIAAYSPEGRNWISGSNRPVVTCCEVDEQGRKKFVKLFSFSQDDIFLNTQNHLNFDRDNIILVGSYLRFFRIMKLNFVE